MNYLQVEGIDTHQVFKELHVTAVSDVACRAAIELDNARRGAETFDFVMCHLMVRWLRGLAVDDQRGMVFGVMEIIWPLLKPDDEGHMRVPYPYRLTRTCELIIAIDHFASQIERVATHPEWYRENDCASLDMMRDFCIEVSQSASLAEWEDHYPHRLVA